MVASQQDGDSRRTVLVVDDDPKFAGIVARCLRGAGHECVIAGSGEDALRAVIEHQPEAIVLDVMMPAPDGMEVCRRLRDEGWAGAIVMVSARSNSADRDAAARAGADMFLAKPFPLDDLVSAITSLLGTRGR